MLLFRLLLCSTSNFITASLTLELRHESHGSNPPIHHPRHHHHPPGPPIWQPLTALREWTTRPLPVWYYGKSVQIIKNVIIKYNKYMILCRYMCACVRHLNIRVRKYMNWYFRLPPGRLSVWNPNYLDIYIHLNGTGVSFYLRASWSGRPSTYLHVVIVYSYIYIYMHACMHTYIDTYIHYITLHYITLRCVALRYVTLHYITLHTYISMGRSSIHVRLLQLGKVRAN